MMTREERQEPVINVETTERELQNNSIPPTLMR